MDDIINTIDGSGNINIGSIRVNGEIAISSENNHYGKIANFDKIQVDNKIFVDNLKNVYASSVMTHSINTNEIKINGKKFVDGNRNFAIKSLNLTETTFEDLSITNTNGIMLARNIHAKNIYLPFDDDPTVGRILCSTVNPKNIIIPKASNCYFANSDFSLVISGFDSSIQCGNIKCETIDASGYVITCEKINAHKFVFPIIASNSKLPKADLEIGQTYFNNSDNKIYVYVGTISGNRTWNVYEPNLSNKFYDNE